MTGRMPAPLAPPAPDRPVRRCAVCSRPCRAGCGYCSAACRNIDDPHDTDYPEGDDD